MTCVATQDETISLVLERLAILQPYPNEAKDSLKDVTQIFDKAVKEIEGDGLTMETCRNMARILAVAEAKAQLYANGLKSVHQSMALLVPEGASEGQKDWP